MDGMDVGESRKRPLQSDSDHFMIKRSNNGQGGDVLLKQLIPAHLAGVILGKGGETIIGLQETTGANIKMSKGTEYYPGTTDRVCLITGGVESVRAAHNAIWQKIETRVNSSNNAANDELKVKIVVPNATVGMIIGKAGSYVKQIKDETKAFVQISQKSADTLLVERVVTIAGSTEQISNAFEMVYKMITEDPQSGSCPYISYTDFKGPVANANPSGSPFATSHSTQPMDVGFGGGFGVYPGGNMSMMGGGFAVNSPSNPALNALKSTLRNSGFSVQASDEITAAMCTLYSYGLLKSGSVGLAGFGFGAGAGQCGLSLDYLSSILAGQALNVDGSNMQKADGSKYCGLAITGSGSMMSQSMGDRGEPMATSSANITKDLNISENLVGAVLGRGGQAIVEIQCMTTTNIQISKKGVFAPGTRDRIATITGSQAGVDRAIYLIQQCIQQEEMKRSRQEHLLK